MGILVQRIRPAYDLVSRACGQHCRTLALCGVAPWEDAFCRINGSWTMQAAFSAFSRVIPPLSLFDGRTEVG
jgi:hypothetical protein